MPKRSRSRSGGGTPFDAACDLLAEALEGSYRRDLVDTLCEGADGAQALARLRTAMAAHTFPPAGGASAEHPALVGGLPLRPLVREWDRRTMKEGFQVLKDWDGRAARFRREIVAVNMLDYYVHAGGGAEDPGGDLGGGEGVGSAAASSRYASRRGQAVPLRQGLAILLDNYFLYLLALASVRLWDEGDPDANMDRVAELLEALNGEGGSGHPVLGSVDGLFWLAISNYHPDDGAYDRLLEKVRTLDARHRLRFAVVGAAVLGTHLRWGFEAYYKRDLNLLRRDNFADYPWLLFSLATLMDRYHEMREEGVPSPARREVVLAILNGLTSDPPAFHGILPPALAAHAEEQARFSGLYHRYQEDLHEEFEAFRPSEEVYSPIAFHFNFPHNAVKAMVGMALTGWALPPIPLEALFEDPGGAGKGKPQEELARTLMAHSEANPEQIGARRVMVMTYMPRTGLRRFRATLWGDLDPLAEEGAGAGESPGEEGAEVQEAVPQSSEPPRTDRLTGSPFQRGDTVEEETLTGSGPSGG
jgi:hypothetical protein